MPSFANAATVMAAALLSLVLVGPSARAVDIVGHRGASADAPENTVSSWKLGYAQGADACELDIHLTKDGKIIVSHDPSTKRTAGVDKKIAETNFDELRKLDVGKWGKWAGKGFTEKLPTLDEALALVPPGKRFLIEIKTHAEIMPALEEVIRRTPLKPEQTVFISFQYDAIEAAKKAFPDRQAYWLADYKQDKKTGKFPDLDELITKAKAAKLDGLDLSFKFPLDAAAVKKIHDAGLQCHVWTVDDPAKARELAKAGVDSITTNRPGALRKELQQAPAAPAGH
jgi:glycerophosphoryl diester phosphodiesterase